jgi:hypothetical protein
LSPLRAPKLTCTYGLVSRRGIPLSPAAAILRDLLIAALRTKPVKMHRIHQ